MTGLENRLSLQLERMLTIYRDLQRDKELNPSYVSKVERDTEALLEEVDRPHDCY